LLPTEEPVSPLTAEEPPTAAELPAEPPSVEEAPAESQADPETAPGQDSAIQEAERQLIAKYPLVNIKPGSLRGAGKRPEHPGKRTVVILCGRCNRARVLATSDLFHVRYCESCAKIARKDARKAKKEGQS
jgi:hypothetical protein